MGGAAWPFLVGGVICLVNSVNEQDPRLINSSTIVFFTVKSFLEGRSFYKMKEDGGNNRSVMPLDVLGSARITLMHSTSIEPWPRGLGNLVNMHRDRDRLLQLLILNKEFLVTAVHQTAMITSLPFVHTACCTYRLNGPVRTRDYGLAPSLGPDHENLSKPYHLEEGEVVTRFP
jgi:hypothetical protein